MSELRPDGVDHICMQQWRRVGGASTFYFFIFLGWLAGWEMLVVGSRRRTGLVSVSRGVVSVGKVVYGFGGKEPLGSLAGWLRGSNSLLVVAPTLLEFVIIARQPPDAGVAATNLFNDDSALMNFAMGFAAKFGFLNTAEVRRS